MMASQEVVIRNSPMQPAQRKMMGLLPLAFGLILARFPAGILVYWVASNLISLIQNLVIYRPYPNMIHEAVAKEFPAKKPTSTAPKKRRKKKSKSRK